MPAKAPFVPGDADSLGLWPKEFLSPEQGGCCSGISAPGAGGWLEQRLPWEELGDLTPRYLSVCKTPHTEMKLLATSKVCPFGPGDPKAQARGVLRCARNSSQVPLLPAWPPGCTALAASCAVRSVLVSWVAGPGLGALGLGQPK